LPRCWRRDEPRHALPAWLARASPALISQASARRWIAVELVAFAAWTALLTFIGPFFIDRIGVRTATAGWLLAGGAAE
jgi:hypothetical protein